MRRNICFKTSVEDKQGMNLEKQAQNITFMKEEEQTLNNFNKIQGLSSLQRMKLLNWIKVAFDALNLGKRTYFLTIHMLDDYIKEKQNMNMGFTLDHLHLLVASMIFIVTKVEEIRPLSVILIEKEICNY